MTMEQNTNITTPGLDSAIRRVVRLLGAGQRALVRRGDDFVVVTAKDKRVRGMSGLAASLVAEMQRRRLVVAAAHSRRNRRFCGWRSAVMPMASR